MRVLGLVVVAILCSAAFASAPPPKAGGVTQHAETFEPLSAIIKTTPDNMFAYGVVTDAKGKPVLSLPSNLIANMALNALLSNGKDASHIKPGDTPSQVKVYSTAKPGSADVAVTAIKTNPKATAKALAKAIAAVKPDIKTSPSSFPDDAKAAAEHIAKKLDKHFKLVRVVKRETQVVNGLKSALVLEGVSMNPQAPTTPTVSFFAGVIQKSGKFTVSTAGSCAKEPAKCK